MEDREKSSADRQLEKLERGLRPRIWLLSIVVCVLALFCFGVYPFVFSPSFLSSGPISDKHQFIGADCKRCHPNPFQTVANESCQSCHALSAHGDKAVQASASSHAMPLGEMRCVSCHAEHQGNSGLVSSDSRQCTSCHSFIESRPQHASKNVESFGNHPEFSIQVIAEGKQSCSYLDDSALKDSTHLKLNHKLHLKAGLRGPQGPQQLYCADCHKLSADFSGMQRVSFEANCKSCHPLEFDARLPGKEVPHAKPKEVYNFLYAEYAKLLLDAGAGESNKAQYPRFRPGEAAEVSEPKEYLKRSVEDQARNAEQEIFTRTGCFLCHDVKKSGEPSTEAVQGSENSRYDLLKPGLPEKWMVRANFSHGAHEELTCLSCHDSAERSESTSDLLLPRVRTCQKCHNEVHRMGSAPATCTTCHSYHDSLPLASERKKPLSLIVEKDAAKF